MERVLSTKLVIVLLLGLTAHVHGQCDCSATGTVGGTPCRQNNICPCRPDGGNYTAGKEKCISYVDLTHPGYSFVSGGTYVLLVGGYFGLDNQTTSLNITCQQIVKNAQLVLSNDTHLIFRTPNFSDVLSTNSTSDFAAGISLHVAGNTFTVLFLLKPDPVILSISPSQSFLSGGIRQTIIGRNLDFVIQPTLKIVAMYDYIKPYDEGLGPYCTVSNSTTMFCRTPPISKCPAAIHFCGTRGGRRRRKKRSLNDPEFQFFMGILMGGFEKYLNLSTELGTGGIIDIFYWPKISLNQDVQVFDQYAGQKHISIPGEFLYPGADHSDYIVTIGKDGNCRVGAPGEGLLASHIKCFPPETPPTHDSFGKGDAYRVIVNIGTQMPFTAAYVKYCNAYMCQESRRLIVVGAAAGGAALMLLIIVIVIVVKCRQRRETTRRDSLMDQEEYVQRYAITHPTNLLAWLPSGDVRNAIQECLLDSDHLDPFPPEHSIGEGQYGRVYRASYKPPNSENSMVVAIKTMKDWTPEHIEEARMEYVKSAQEFMDEALIMRPFKHENVISLVGVIIDGPTPYVVLPYMDNGSLLDFLKNRNNTFSVKDLVGFGRQGACGMAYLHEASGGTFIHRDLAARNCMVDMNDVVKIADFGLARDKDDYYRVADTSRRLPFKWMAIESMEENIFSNKSDVWSYGVLLWEMLTRCKKPYENIHNNQLKQYLQAGGRLPNPPECPDVICHLMQSCWKHSPDDRPSFVEILRNLEHILYEEGGEGPIPDRGRPENRPDRGRGRNNGPGPEDPERYSRLLRYRPADEMRREGYLSIVESEGHENGYLSMQDTGSGAYDNVAYHNDRP